MLRIAQPLNTMAQRTISWASAKEVENEAGVAARARRLRGAGVAGQRGRAGSGGQGGQAEGPRGGRQGAGHGQRSCKREREHDPERPLAQQDVTHGDTAPLAKDFHSK